jgi:hypothetical protein
MKGFSTSVAVFLMKIEGYARWSLNKCFMVGYINTSGGCVDCALIVAQN